MKPPVNPEIKEDLRRQHGFNKVPDRVLDVIVGVVQRFGEKLRGMWQMPITLPRGEDVNAIGRELQSLPDIEKTLRELSSTVMGMNIVQLIEQIRRRAFETQNQIDAQILIGVRRALGIDEKPSPGMLDAYSGTRKVLQQPGTQDALRERIVYGGKFAPRSNKGPPMNCKQLTARVRDASQAPEALGFVDAWAESLAGVEKVYRKLEPTLHIPRSEGATSGNGELSPADIADWREFLHYALIVGLRMVGDQEHFAQDNDIDDTGLNMEAHNDSAASVVQAFCIRFTLDRFATFGLQLRENADSQETRSLVEAKITCVRGLQGELTKMMQSADALFAQEMQQSGKVSPATGFVKKYLQQISKSLDAAIIALLLADLTRAKGERKPKRESIEFPATARPECSIHIALLKEPTSRKGNLFSLRHVPGMTRGGEFRVAYRTDQANIGGRFYAHYPQGDLTSSETCFIPLGVIMEGRPAADILGVLRQNAVAVSAELERLVAETRLGKSLAEHGEKLGHFQIVAAQGDEEQFAYALVGGADVELLPLPQPVKAVTADISQFHEAWHIEDPVDPHMALLTYGDDGGGDDNEPTPPGPVASKKREGRRVSVLA